MSSTFRRITCFTFVLALGLAPLACGGSSITGDWFECEDAACQVLDDDGIRFGDDGRFWILDAPGSTLDPGEAYAVSPISGSYEFDGSQLSISLAAEGEHFQGSVDAQRVGDILELMAVKHEVHCSAALGGKPQCTHKQASKVTRMKLIGLGYGGGQPGAQDPPPPDSYKPVDPTLPAP